MTIYIVDIEAVDTRYTKQWKEIHQSNATCYKRRSKRLVEEKYPWRLRQILP